MTATDDPEDPPECGYCGRRFADADVLALHKGQDHPEAIGPEEQRAYEAATAAETEALRRFRLKALAALVFVYFGFLFAYSAFG